jgi:regulatory protein
MPRERRLPRPLDAATLDALALSYVARFATSEAKLATYLRRKVAERGWDAPGTAPVAAIVARFAEAGYIDDAAFARGKSAALHRRGYGARRVGQALIAAGIGEDTRAAAIAEGDPRAAALAFARRRRIGPFGPGDADRVLRERQIAAMLRAGHPLDSARALVNAESVDAAEEWAAEGQE